MKRSIFDMLGGRSSMHRRRLISREPAPTPADVVHAIGSHGQCIKAEIVRRLDADRIEATPAGWGGRVTQLSPMSRSDWQPERWGPSFQGWHDVDACDR